MSTIYIKDLPKALLVNDEDIVLLEQAGITKTVRAALLKGKNGVDGKGIEYTWNGTQLGIRLQGQSEYVFVDLKGEQGLKGLKGDKGDQGLKGDKGDKGEQGLPFKISKVYESVESMNADFSNVQVKTNDFVIINTIDINNPDNSKLFIKGETAFNFITDLSGAQGIQGPKGDKGDQGIQGPKGDKGENGLKGDKGDSFTYSDFTPEQLALLKGEQGIQGLKGDKGEPGQDAPHVDLSNYYTIPQTDTKIAEEIAKAQVGGGVDLTDYATKTYVGNEIEKISLTPGPKGDKGDPGIQGERGAQGPKGEQGLKGADGIQGAKGDKGEKGDAFIYSDFTPEQLTALKGEKGDKGDPGLKGDKGDKGEKGDQGPQGPPGTGGSGGGTSIFRYEPAGTTDHNCYVCATGEGVTLNKVGENATFTVPEGVMITSIMIRFEMADITSAKCKIKYGMGTDYYSNYFLPNFQVWIDNDGGRAYRPAVAGNMNTAPDTLELTGMANGQRSWVKLQFI